jgi:uncharacterized RDD family membrane protein YckC
MDAKFCQHCGHNIQEKSTKLPTCSICHTMYDDGSLFCPNDGGVIKIQVEGHVPKQQKQFANKRRTREQEMESFDGIYPKGDLGNRFGASILDGLVFWALMIPSIVFVVIGFSVRQSSYYGALSGSNDSEGVVFFILAGLCFLIPLIYAFIKDGFGEGQSVGKKACNLMVVNLDTHEPCDKGKSAMRHFISFLIGLVPYVGWIVEPIMVLANQDGRKVADNVCNTQVVDVKVYREYQEFLKNQENINDEL